MLIKWIIIICSCFSELLIGAYVSVDVYLANNRNVFYFLLSMLVTLTVITLTLLNLMEL